jgi:hypothetical protein
LSISKPSRGAAPEPGPSIHISNLNAFYINLCFISLLFGVWNNRETSKREIRRVVQRAIVSFRCQQERRMWILQAGTYKIGTGGTTFDDCPREQKECNQHLELHGAWVIPSIKVKL